MKYDKYVKDEVVLNCKEQGYLDFMIESYAERVIHEVNLNLKAFGI